VTQVADDFLSNDLKSFISRRISDHLMSNYIEKIKSHVRQQNDSIDSC